MKKYCMFKKVYFSGMMFAAAFALSGCQGKAEPASTVSQPAGNYIYTQPAGTPGVAPPKFNAEDITAADIDYSDDMEDIGRILAGSTDTDEEKQIYDRIRVLINTLAGGKFAGDDGCYVSTVTIRRFEAGNNKVNSSRYIIIFNEDMSDNVCISLGYVGGLGGGELILTGKDEYELMEYYEENPQEKLICCIAGTALCVLDSSNEIYPSWVGSGYPVEGDYYNALDYELLGVSYEELTNPDNLVWYDFVGDEEIEELIEAIKEVEIPVDSMSREELAEKYEVYQIAVRNRMDPEEFLDSVIAWLEGGTSPGIGLKVYGAEEYEQYMDEAYGEQWREWMTEE